MGGWMTAEGREWYTSTWWEARTFQKEIRLIPLKFKLRTNWVGHQTMKINTRQKKVGENLPPK